MDSQRSLSVKTPWLPMGRSFMISPAVLTAVRTPANPLACGATAAATSSNGGLLEAQLFVRGCRPGPDDQGVVPLVVGQHRKVPRRARPNPPPDQQTVVPVDGRHQEHRVTVDAEGTGY